MSRTAMKQKRNSAVSRSTENIDSVLRHVGKKQFLFLEVHICTINRITLDTGEEFSETKANTLLEKYHRKRQAHCNASFLEDRISFERTKSTGNIPFRPWVGYGEIIQMFKIKSKPEYFVLFVDSKTSLQKYYEIYKCKSIDNMKKVEDYIRRAMNDPDKRLHDLNAKRQVNVIEDERTRSIANFEMQNSRETMVESEPENGDELFVNPTNTSVLEYRSPSPDLIQLPNETKANNYINGFNGKLDNYSITNLEDVTYICVDPHKGAMVNNCGPIYMYFARMENDNTNKEGKQYDNNVHSTVGW